MHALDIDTLRTFLTCVTAPSFAEAGLRVNKSQSTVSMQIKRLEEVVGQKLFAKSGRRNHLTAAGQELQDYARRIVHLNDEALTRFNPRSIGGRISIGTPDDYADAFLPDVFGRFAARHPTVEVAITCASSLQLNDMLDAGELDFAILTLGGSVTGAECLHTEPLSWVAPVDRSLEAERPLPVAVWHAGCVWRALAVTALEGASIPYRIAYVGSSASALTTTVRAGLAVAALPYRFMGNGLRLVPPSAGLPEPGAFEVGIKRADNGPRPLVDAFAAETKAAFARFQAVMGDMVTSQAA
ncbi:MAG: LysR substrate-binding domain-containing protein [Pseudomonadota bacterium]